MPMKQREEKRAWHHWNAEKKMKASHEECVDLKRQVAELDFAVQCLKEDERKKTSRGQSATPREPSTVVSNGISAMSQLYRGSVRPN